MPKPTNGWHRANKHSAAAKARRAKYNSPEYKQRRAADAKLVAAGLAYCWRTPCRKWINPAEPWHEGHDDLNPDLIRGPEHPACNLKAAAVKGNRLSKAKKRRAVPPAPVRRRSLLG